MNDQCDLLEEYFDRSTSTERKKQIKAELGEIASSTGGILLELGDSVKNEPAIAQLRERLAGLKEPKPWKRAYWVAASLTLLILLSMVFVLVKSQRTSHFEQLFVDFYTPYPVDIYRGNDEGSPGGLVAYRQGDYEKAIPILSSQIENHSNRDLLLIYLGNCYLNVDQVKKAIEIFQQVSPNGAHHNDAQWFLALSYTRKNETGKSKKILTELINTDNPYNEVANQLLKVI